MISVTLVWIAILTLLMMGGFGLSILIDNWIEKTCSKHKKNKK